jgi:hypothetical protein
MTLLLLHAAATLFMAGLIWFVQIVHYPLFAALPDAAAAPYCREHARRTGWVVGAPMLVEAVAAVLLALVPPPGISRAVALAGLVLLGAIWLSTAVWQVPAHRQLGEGHDLAAHRRLVARLVATNWVRTAAWSARGALALAMLAAVT